MSVHLEFEAFFVVKCFTNSRTLLFHIIRIDSNPNMQYYCLSKNLRKLRIMVLRTVSLLLKAFLCWLNKYCTLELCSTWAVVRTVKTMWIQTMKVLDIWGQDNRGCSENIIRRINIILLFCQTNILEVFNII